MHIRTFTGSDDDMSQAVKEAELSADQLLENLGRGELISVTAQSFVDRFDDMENGSTVGGGHTCFHIITIIYE